SANTDEAVLTSLEPDTDVRSGVENADPEAAGAGERPVLLTSVGLRPPSVSKTAALMNKLFPFFGLTSLTNEQILQVSLLRERVGFRRCGDDLLFLRKESKQRHVRRETLTAVQGTHRTHKAREYAPRPNPPLLYLSPTAKRGAPLLDNPLRNAKIPPSFMLRFPTCSGFS
ncbi:MAG: hypothetical protein LIO55_00350, partial [Oscillospiraceae bacterium]|nr:hypothetical protein [Oscillospiraceae bacterium]